MLVLFSKTRFAGAAHMGAPRQFRQSGQILQATARSTCESESVALADGVTDALWIRNLLMDLLQPIQTLTRIYCDNKSTIDIEETN